MGYSNWSANAYKNLASKRKSKSRAAVFTSTNVDPSMNPHGITQRESRDSPAHPNSNAIVVGFDVTGSMGHIPESFAKEKLGGLMRMLTERDYIEDPQVLFAAIGDGYCDRGPLQVGQFESGLEMDMWLTRMWLEGGGGGQKSESYALAHYFAAKHTSTDCFLKRGKKGYLFTMGDELTWGVPGDQVNGIFGYDPERDYTAEDVIREAQRKYEVFHIIVAEGYHGRDPEVLEHWRELLGERVLVMPDANGVCELIGTTIAVMEEKLDLAGVHRDLRDLGASAKTATAVADALAPIAAKRRPVKSTSTLPKRRTKRAAVDRVERL